MKKLSLFAGFYLCFLWPNYLRSQHFTKSVVRCEDTLYLEKRAPWYLGLDETCTTTLYQNNFQDIPTKDLQMIESIEKDIIERGGDAFYQKLTLVSVNVVDKPKNCQGIAYAFRYALTVSENFNYRFNLFYDSDGKLSGNPAFPNVKADPHFFNLTSPCDLRNETLADDEFLEFYEQHTPTLSRISLNYDVELGTFVYEMHGELVKGSKQEVRGNSAWFYGRKVIFNAKTGEKLRTERTKEKKIVLESME